MNISNSLYNKKLWGFLFVLPALIHLLMFRIIPTVYIAVISFQPMSMGVLSDASSFTLRNYQSLNSPRFFKVLGNTFYYVIGGLVILSIFSLLLALLLNRGSCWGLFRAVYFYPYTVIMVATGIIWAYGFKADGFINYLISLVGFEAKNWLGGDGRLAMPAMITTTCWRYLGYFAVIYLSGLQAIPQTLYEAAKVDGANAFQQFRYVTIPLLKPIIQFVMVMSSIELLRQFAIPFVMTGGGPANSTNVLALDTYNRAFAYFNMNQAAAEAMILIAFAVGLSIVQYNVFNRMKGED